MATSAAEPPEPSRRLALQEVAEERACESNGDVGVMFKYIFFNAIFNNNNIDFLNTFLQHGISKDRDATCMQ